MKRTALRTALILLTAVLAVLIIAAVSSGTSGQTELADFSFSGNDSVKPTDETPDSADGPPIDAPYIDQPNRKSDYYIVVFLKSQLTVVYGKDAGGGYSVPVKCFVCSTGAGSGATRDGLYSIQRRYRWRLLVGDVYGQYATGFSDSYLFHSVPYAAQDPSTLDMDGYASLGQPASHGCVRLCVRDSKWIFENCPDGTQINIIDESCELTGEAVPPLVSDSDCFGWDPSDQNGDNPYTSR